MMSLIFRPRRLVLAVLLALLAATGARAQAPESGYWDRTPLPQAGLATYYDPGLMEQVQEYRLTAGDINACPDCVGAVALLRAGDIGRKVWLAPPGGDPVGPFLVVDCARRQDVQPLLDRNWVVDVSYQVGQYWGMDRPLDGVIVFEDPADQIPGVETNRIPTPFYVEPMDVVISSPTPTPSAMAAAGIMPTAWPTRMPVPLFAIEGQGIQAAPTEPPIPPTPTAIWPPPLTPIITTPTPAVTPEPTAEPVSSPSLEGGDAVPSLTPAPTSSPTEVSRGQAGSGLLDRADESPTPTPVDFGHEVTPTARPTLARTPRPALTPLLPIVATPSPTATIDADRFEQWLRSLMGLIDE